MKKYSYIRNCFLWTSCVILLLFSGLPKAAAQQEQITILVQEKNYSEAASELEKLLRVAEGIETRSWCYYQLGEIYYNYTQQYQKALNAYRNILKMQNDGLPIAEIYLAYIKIGDVYTRMGEYEKAIQNLNTLVRMTDETNFVHKISSQKIRDIQKGLRDLSIQREIVREYKGTSLEVVAQFQIAEIYRSQSQLNQPETAIETYQTLLKNHPTHKMAPEAQWRIAHIRHTVLHQTELAVDAYKKVADTYPTSNFAAEALFHIASIHRQDEEFKQALTVYDTIKERYPNFWITHAVFYWSGVCHEKLKNYSDARRAFQVFLKVYLPSLDPVDLGQIEMYDKTVLQVRELIQTKINTLTKIIPKHEYEKIENAIESNQYLNALSYARNLIVIAPDSEYAKRISSRLRSLEYHAAIQSLQIRINDANFDTAKKTSTQLQIATIYERELHDYAKAVDAYNTVIEDNPRSIYAAEARYRIGIISADILAKPNTALQAFNAVIKHHPNTLEAMMATFQIAEIYEKLQRFDEALQAYQKTSAYPERELYLSGGYKDSFADRAQFRIGRVHFEDKRFAEARFAFEEFIKNRPNSPRFAAAHVFLAVMHQENGETDLALKYYQKAESLLNKNGVQAQTVIDEAGSLGFQGTDTVIKFLQERQNRLKNE